MYGVVASQTAGEAIVLDALASIDFVNEVYTISGSPVSVSSIIDQPGKVGASGLEVADNDEFGVVEILGDLLALLVTLDWTVVIEYQQVTTGSSTKPLAMRDTAWEETIQFDRQFTNDFWVSEVASTERYVQSAGTVGAGIHRVAVTRTDAQLAMSVDGGAVDTEVAAQATTVDLAAFGGQVGNFSNDGCFIRSLTIYAPVENSLLIQLSS